ncbi:MAG: hypothetical protein SPH83_11670 [Treponema sp.]|nr:hypothetical protein [Spirochaetales bacterium]MDY6191133.1 hypothetical protein [Treponema sp.]
MIKMNCALSKWQKSLNLLRLCHIVLIFLGTGSLCFAQSLGEKLFKENNPKDAVQVLENEILNGQISANTYNFLGLGYYQIGEYEKSVDAFERGIKEQPVNAKILYFNQGNAYYALKQFEKAAECFSLSYKSDLSFVDALLNRANSYLMDDKLVLAKNDYVDYLEKFPETPQKSKIELLINAITDEIERRKEEERLLEEQNKALWEHINPNITEYDDENKVEWELIDDEIADVQEKKENMNWQEVGDNRIGEIEIPENKKNWEEIDSENTQVGKIDEQNSKYGLVSDENNDTDENENSKDFDEFEKVEHENEISFAENDDFENEEEFTEAWENLSEEDAQELKKLEIQSEKEYEQWLKQQKLQEKRKQQEENLRKKMKEDEERQKTQELLEQMMKAENERRQKLLEDVQNSLQGNDSTNVSSGADDIIDLDYEGELD